MTSPQTALVHAPFAGGLAQKTDPRHVSFGELLTAQNVRQDKNGRLVKRPGCTTLASTMGGTALNTGAGRVVPYDDNGLLVIDGYRAGVYAPAKGADLIFRDEVPEAVITRKGGAHTAINAAGFDQATDGTYIVRTWIEFTSSGNQFGPWYYSYWTAEDATTGALVSGPNILANGSALSAARVVYFNGVFAFVWMGSSTTLVGATFAAGTWLSGTLATLRSDVAAGPPNVGLSFAVDATATRLILAYTVTSGGPGSLRIYAYDSTLVQKGTVSPTETTVGHSPIFPALAATTGEGIWLCYFDGTGGTQVRAGYYAATDALTEIVAPFSAYTPSNLHTQEAANMAVCRLSATQAVVVAAYFQDTFTTYIVQPVISTSGTVARVAVETYSLLPASKPFVRSGKSYCWAYVGQGASSGTSQYSYALLNLETDVLSTSRHARVVGRSAVRFSAPEGDKGSQDILCSVLSPSTDKYISVFRTRLSDLRFASNVATADFAHPGRWQAAKLGPTTYFAGGSPAFFDGATFAEIGFEDYAQNLSATQAVSTGLAAGTYQYVVVYEWLDAHGEVHRSIPSAPLSVAVAASNTTVTLVFRTLGLTEKSDSDTAYFPTILANVYRTTAGSTGPFYQVFQPSQVPQMRADDPNTLQAVQDNFADGAINTNPQLYTGLVGTAASAVDNVAPPSFTCLVAHRGRLFGIGDDERTLWFSKQYVPGESVAFADEFTIPCDDRIVALASLDSNLVLFGTSRIWTLSGDGPNDGGLNSDYGLPQPVATDQGCVDPRSVVVTQEGVFFQSAVGLYLLDRGLNVSYVGPAVDDDLTTYPTIAAATVHPTGQHVLFTANGSSTGVRLVYDYRTKHWYRDVVNGGTTVVSSCAWPSPTGNVLVWLDSAGKVWKEDSTTWLDNGSWVTMSAELAFVHAPSASADGTGVQGYQRAHRVTFLGYRFSACDLRVDIGQDYLGTYGQTKTWTASGTIDGLVTLPIVQLSEHVAQQKTEAVRVKFTDAAPTGDALGTGQGLAFLSAGFEVEPLHDTFRLPATQKG